MAKLLIERRIGLGRQKALGLTIGAMMNDNPSANHLACRDLLAGLTPPRRHGLPPGPARQYAAEAAMRIDPNIRPKCASAQMRTGLRIATRRKGFRAAAPAAGR